MRSRSPAGAAVALAVTVGVGWVALAPASAATTVRALCQHRVCVYLLDTKSDRDGDGVTDVDEIAAGTDPDDARSHPGAPQLIELVLGGRLPSFERHLTELVVLPTNTPDGDALATGLGAFSLPTKAWLYNSPGDALTKIRGNGFTGFTTAVASFGGGPAGSGMPPWGAAGGMSLIAAGDGIDGPTNASPNGGKPVAEINGGGVTSEGKRIPEFSYSYDSGGRQDITEHTYTVVYADGSRDEVNTVAWLTGSGTESQTTIQSYDSKNNHIGTTEVHNETSTTKDGDGQSRSTATTVHDPSGATGTSETTVTHTTEDGETTVHTQTSTSDGGHSESTDKDHGHYDPNYMAPGPITAADFALVVSRIKSSQTPGPDTGLADATSGPLPPSKLPLIALINPDGVVSIAAGGTPTFNRALPDYDPRLAELAGHAGVGAPVHHEGGGVSWPD
jgi:hypothetical protein